MTSFFQWRYWKYWLLPAHPHLLLVETFPSHINKVVQTQLFGTVEAVWPKVSPSILYPVIWLEKKSWPNHFSHKTGVGENERLKHFSGVTQVVRSWSRFTAKGDLKSKLKLLMSRNGPWVTVTWSQSVSRIEWREDAKKSRDIMKKKEIFLWEEDSKCCLSYC